MTTQRSPQGDTVVENGAGPADTFADPFAAPALPRTPKAPQRRFRGHIPGEVGIWVFILGDMLVFALFFGVFTYERAQAEALFDSSRETLNVGFGAVNTLLLLTGSWFVVTALGAARRGALQVARRMVLVALVCGAAFVVNKVLEYSSKISAGHGPGENDFYMYFFMFTGIHLLHLLIGLVVLVLMWRVLKKPAIAANDNRTLEACASYWHLVDLLWVVLFALLYLMT